MNKNNKYIREPMWKIGYKRIKKGVEENSLMAYSGNIGIPITDYYVYNMHNMFTVLHKFDFLGFVTDCNIQNSKERKRSMIYFYPTKKIWE